MILYHGTNTEFDKIDLQKSKPNTDFGRGFYLSDNYAQAFSMAETKMEQLETGSPIVMAFEVDDRLFNLLHILRFETYDEEWAKFILLNRNNPQKTNAHAYDVVIGPIANDTVGAQLWRYENNSIDLPTLVKNLQYMKGLTIQYFFGTEKAIQTLRRL